MSAQTDKSDVRRGNRQFRKGDYSNAELSYRMALAKDSTSFAAAYDLANTAYMQGDYQSAAKLYSKIAGRAIVEGHGFDFYFNAGVNAAAMEDWQNAVKAFRQAIILDPENLEAKENYIYAKQKLDEQQPGNQGSDGQNSDKDDEDNDKEMDDKEREKTDPDPNQGGNEHDDDKYYDDPDADKAQKDENSERSVKNLPSQAISGQQAGQILQAIQSKESETKDKVNRQKALVEKSRKKEKNW